jgi:beta-carotene 3-hydroxylase
MLINSLILIGSFVAMEGVAWLVHKYVMHGLLWSWHQSHHSHTDGVFELNDLFSVIFGLTAIVLILAGAQASQYSWLLWIGIGMSLYGIAYFIFHDIIVHRRVPLAYKPTHPYLKNLIRAHKVHHRNLLKEKGEAFGFLYCTKNYLKKTRDMR